MIQVPLTSTKKNDKYAELIRKRVGLDSQRYERAAWEERLLKNYAYFRGRQNFYFENGRFIDKSNDYPEHRVPYRQNWIRPSGARAVATLMNMEIRTAAVPASASFRHREIARTTQRFHEHIASVVGFEKLKMLMCFSAYIYGTAVLRNTFDPLTGEMDRFYFTDEDTKTPIVEDALSDEERIFKDQNGLFEDLYAGEINSMLVSPFGFGWDWAARDKMIPGCRYGWERHWIDRQVAAERLGMDEDDIPAPSNSRGMRAYEEAVAFMSMNPGFNLVGYSEPEDTRNNRVLWIDYWERPSAHEKEGLRIVSINGQTMNKDTRNPHRGDKTGATHLPWVTQHWIPNVGEFWGSSAVEDQTSAQWQLNEARTSQASFLRCFGNPPLFVPSNTGLDPTKITIHPGGVYSINPNSQPPTSGAIPQLPQGVWQFANDCINDLKMSASQSDVTGNMPGQLRTGVAVDSMNRERHVALNIPGQELAEMVRMWGKQVAVLAKLFYTQKRKMQYLGTDGQYISAWFTAADLSSDVVILGAPNVTDTKEGRLSVLFDAAQSGAIQPQINPDHQRMIVKALHYGSGEESIDRLIEAERNAELDIEKIIEDPTRYAQTGYTVMPWQDHDTEMKQIRSFMYQERFKGLDPLTQSLIADLWIKHSMFAQQELMAQAQAQEATRGAPGQKGVASQPKAASAA